MSEDAYIQEQRELVREAILSPNAWIERSAELRNDTTIDPAYIGVIIRREQVQVVARRAEPTQEEQWER